jgi:hypothetical protein
VRRETIRQPFTLEETVKRRSSRLHLLAASLIAVLCLPADASGAVTCGAWSRVTLPDPSLHFDQIHGVDAVSPTDAWAVGLYGTDESGNHGLIDHWDGSSWTLQDSPHTSGVSEWLMGVAEVAPDDVWVVGFSFATQPVLQHFDGSTWSEVAPPTLPDGDGGELLSVNSVPGTSEAWAVGYHSQPNEAHHTLVMHYDGAVWAIVPSPDPSGYQNQLNGVVAASATDAWAVGHQIGFSFVKKTLALHWDGSSWSATTTPNVGTKANELNGVSAAGGKAYAAGTHAARTLIERWNGSRWVVETSPDPGSRRNALTDVAAVSAPGAWVVGYDDNNGPAKTLVEHRSRTGTWSVQAAPSPGALGANLWGVDASSGSDVWAVGQSDSNTAESGLALHLC